MIKKYFQRLASSAGSGTFVRNASILVSGTIIARVVAAASLPLLTRLYSPEDFRLLAIIMSLTTLVTVISSLRFNVAVPIPERDEDAVNLLALCILICLLISAGCIGVAAIYYWTGQGGSSLDMSAMIWLVPLAILGSAVFQALLSWHLRKKNFKLITQTRVIRAIGAAGVQITFGLIGYTYLGLQLGYLVYCSLGIVALFNGFWQKNSDLLQSISKRNLREKFVEYKRFPVFSVPEALANTAGLHVPILIIAAIGPKSEAGHLALAMQVMGVPMSLIGSSVAQVYLSEAPERFRAGTLRRFTVTTTKNLFKIGIPVIGGIALLAPLVFPIVFGAQWARAGEIILWMAPMYIFQFATSPVSRALHVSGRLKLAMSLQIFGLIIRIIPLLVIAGVGSGFITETFAVFSFIFYIIYLFIVLRAIPLEEK